MSNLIAAVMLYLDDPYSESSSSWLLSDNGAVQASSLLGRKDGRGGWKYNVGRNLPSSQLKFQVDEELLMELDAETRTEYLQWRHEEDLWAQTNPQLYFDQYATSNSISDGIRLRARVESWNQQFTDMLPQPREIDDRARKEEIMDIDMENEEETVLDDADQDAVRIPLPTEDREEPSTNFDSTVGDIPTPGGESMLSGLNAQMGMRWFGDEEFLIKNEVPTCMGVPCQKKEYFDMMANLTKIGKVQRDLICFPGFFQRK
jgi:hypothetical protein